ncbi:MAG: acetoacetate decarboxylase family protein [Planctomycetota bacterium]|nr:acetoacetate decarboxylase family protein [Planctomycetota bacterium]
MKNGSYFVEHEKLNAFNKSGAMNEEEGLYIFWETDQAVARHILPKQLELADPKHPMVYSYAHAVVEAKGRRIFEAEIEIGGYIDPMIEAAAPKLSPGSRAEGYCFNFKYNIGGESPKAALIGYDSPTDYRTYEVAGIKSISMEPSLDDPWSELAVVKPLYAAYSINSNWVRSVHMLATFEGREADDLFSHLFTGRYDRSTICTGHQRYGQY